MRLHLFAKSLIPFALAAAAHAQCASNGITDGMIAYWNFNDGTAIDQTGHGHDGIMAGTSPGVGVYGADIVNSDNGYVQIADSPELNPTDAITVSAWWFATSFVGTGSDPLVDKGAYCHCWPYYQYHLAVTGDHYGTGQGGVAFNIATNTALGGAGTSGGTCIVGNWYHLVGTYDGAMVRLFVNGALVNENPLTGQIFNFGRPVLIGHFGNLGYALPGGIDEVRIYSRALSSAEVLYTYNHPDGSLGFDTQPLPQNICAGHPAIFHAHATGPGAISYQWRKNSSPIPGETGPTLTIPFVAGADSAGYDCIATSGCASAVSAAAPLAVCIADLDDGSSTGQCDGGVTIDDLLYFLGLFAAGDVGADVDDGSATGAPDGGVTIDDLLYFLTHFAAGC